MEDDTLKDLPRLPNHIKFNDWLEIYPTQDVWRLRLYPDSSTEEIINWSRLENPKKTQNLSKRAWHLVKLYLLGLLEKKRKPTTILNYFNCFLVFAVWLASQKSLIGELKYFHWSDLNQEIIDAFAYHCRKNTGSKGNYFKPIRGIYEWGNLEGYRDFDKTTLKLIKNKKIRGGLTGLRGRDGYLDWEEISLIVQAINADIGQPEDRAIIMLLCDSIARPNEVERLLNKDLLIGTEDGSYWLAIPTSKQRGMQPRQTQPPILIRRQLGELLVSIQQGGPEDPLIPSLANVKASRSIINNALKRFVKDANIISHRTGKLLHLYPYRFRYTGASNLADLGESLNGVSNVLSHQFKTTTLIYVQTLPSIVGRMVVAKPVFTTLRNSFLTPPMDWSQKLVLSTNNDYPLILGVVLHLPNFPLNLGAIGQCRRSEGSCNSSPLGCYVCPHFWAFSDGPHLQIFDGINTIIRDWSLQLDIEVIRHLDDVLIAIRELLVQLNLIEENTLINRGYSLKIKQRCIEMYEKEGKTQYEIEDETGIAQQTISDWLKKAGIPTGFKHSDDTREKCLEMYKSGMSLCEIQRQTGIHRQSLTKWVKEAGITIRKG